MIDSEPRRAAFFALAAARGFASDSPAWEPLVRDVLQLPVWMVPAVQRALRHACWRAANDPIKTLKEYAERLAVRMGLSDRPEPAKGE